MTELYLYLNQSMPEGLDPQRLAGLAGLVVEAGCLSVREASALPAPVAALCVRLRATHGQVPSADAQVDWDWDADTAPACVVDAGLDACAALRDAQPERNWLPRLTVYPQEVSYRMANYSGEGFKFFTPDPASIHIYRVTDGDRRLIPTLRRARDLGFERIWLHARDAERRGRGLDLDLLERARAEYPEGLWLSGGATEARHLENLSREGGADGVVIGLDLLQAVGVEALLAALAPPPPEVSATWTPRSDHAAV
jgi:hypothetical protein